MSPSARKVFCCNGAPRPRGKKATVLEYDPHSANQNIVAALPNFVENVLHIPHRILDLLEIAVYVFCADRYASRGSRDAVEYHAWSRSLHFRVRVRDADFWNTDRVRVALAEAIRFMSGDKSITFEFFPGHATAPTNLFDRADTRIQPGAALPAVALFSGGLDSLAGAIELLSSGRKTILVSHESRSGTVRTQRALYNALAENYGALALACRFKCHLKDGRPPEETQRTRAFLYCSIAFAIAEAHGANEAYVHENGVTSINLYRREDQLNARASRTTHPKTMRLMEEVFSLVAERKFALRLPFFDLTKRAVIDRIRRSPMSSSISSAVSCTSAFRSEDASHCGECFQCIDRRIACFAAEVDDVDHAGLYEKDIITSDMTSAEAITAAMDYVRLARNCARNGSSWFENEFASELADMVDAMQPEIGEVEAVERIRTLMKQHGDNVELGIRRMRDRFDDPYDPRLPPPRSLLSMIASRQALKPSDEVVGADRDLHAISAGMTKSAKNGSSGRSSSSNETTTIVLPRESAMKTDCLIITALPKEFDAVRSQYRNWKPVTHPATTAALYETMSPGGLRVVAAIGTTMGQLAASAMATQLLHALDPGAVLLVGIAGGMDRNIKLGDVVASEQIVSYEIGKMTDDGFGPRWSVFRTDARMLSRLNSWSPQTWPQYVRTVSPSRTASRLHVGVYLSGDKVIADSTSAGVLKSVWSRAAAVDMEASAVASAIYHAPRHPPFLVLKGICDYADASKNDDWQEYASEAAATCAFSFVIEHLQPGDVGVASGPAVPANAMTSALRGDSRGIRLALAQAFDLVELKTLCFDLQIDWDEIGGMRKTEKIVELLSFVQRRNKLAELVELVNRERNDLLRAYKPGEGA